MAAEALTEVGDFTAGVEVFTVEEDSTAGAGFMEAEVFAAAVRSVAALAVPAFAAVRDSAVALRFGLEPAFAETASVEDFAAVFVTVLAADSATAVGDGEDGVGVVGAGAGA